jgi:hypothetical protein
MARTGERKSYPPVERDAILTMAFHHGPTVAAREFGCTKRTIAEWRRTKPEEWLAICDREGPALERRIVAQTQEVMARVGEIELRNALRIAEGMDELTPKEMVDLAGAQQRLATAKGINGTKLLELTGRPTQVIENRTGADILRQLAAAVPGLVVEGTAVEEPVRAIEPPD